MHRGSYQTTVMALVATVIVTLGATMLAVSSHRAAVEALAIALALGATALAFLLWSLEPAPAQRAVWRTAMAFFAPILLYGFGAGVAVLQGAGRILERLPVEGHDAALAIGGLASAVIVLVAVLYLARSSRDRGDTGPGGERSGKPAEHLTLALACASTAVAATSVSVAVPVVSGPPVVSVDAVGGIVIGLLMAAFAGHLVLDACRVFVPKPLPDRAALQPPPLQEVGPASSLSRETLTVTDGEVQTNQDPVVDVASGERRVEKTHQVKLLPGQKPPVVAKSQARRRRGKRR